MSDHGAKRFKERHPERWKAIQKRSREKNRARLQAQKSKWQKTQNGVTSLMLAGARRRAKERGLDFDLIASDIIVPDACPLLGVPIFRGVGKMGPNSPALDRIETTKGYVRGNVWVISQRANVIKNDATVAELFMIARKLWERVNGI